MIVGCYELHLYCDGKRSRQCFSNRNRPAEYTGETKGQTQRAARKDGWIIRKGVATCPECRPVLSGDSGDVR